MSKYQDQLVALAGAFQAVSLVETLAKTGSVDSDQYQTCINSLFVINPKDTEAVFGQLSNLSHGFSILRELLDTGSSKQSPEALRYGLSLLHLEKKLKRSSGMLEVISNRLAKCEQQLAHFDASHDNITATLADIYSDTISTFSFRIQVRGNYDYLQQTHIANRIRALLFAGIRATVLWRQLGGSRINLVWRRSYFRNLARSLAQEHG